MAEKNTTEMAAKKIMYAMIAVAAVLAIALAYIWIQKSSLVNDLNLEKEELTEQMIALQNDYAVLSSDNETINAQLDSSREEVSQLIERIKRAAYAVGDTTDLNHNGEQNYLNDGGRHQFFSGQ